VVRPGSRWAIRWSTPTWRSARAELGALLVAAGLAGATEHALVSLLGLNGLRISEAVGVDIDDLHVQRGHRTLTVVRKGGKVVTHAACRTRRPGHASGDRRPSWRPGVPVCVRAAGPARR
jgi:hypothetical protein